MDQEEAAVTTSTSTTTTTTTTTTTAKLYPVRGILQLLQPYYHPDLSIDVYEHNVQFLQDTQTQLMRRKRVQLDRSSETPTKSSQQQSFVHLIQQHRLVGFFVVQGLRGGGSYFSPHEVSLRRILATDYWEHMTIFLVNCNETSTDQLSSVFLAGSGFAHLPHHPILHTLLNITQIPTLVVVDTTTGRPLSQDAILALEWNDPHYVLDAWKRGQSGLTGFQQGLALATWQSQACSIS